MIKIFLLLVADILVVAFSLFLAHFFRVLLNPFFHDQHLHSAELYLTFWPIYITTIFIFTIEKVYLSKYMFWQELRYIYKGLMFSFVIVLSFLAITQSVQEYSRTVFLFAYVFMFLLFPPLKIFLKYFLHSFGFMCKKVAIVSSDNAFKSSILSNKYLGYRDSNKDFDVLIIDTNNMNSKKLDAIIQKNMHDTKEILFLPYLKELNFSQVDFIEFFNDRYSLISLSNLLLKPFNIFLKKLFELLIILTLFPIVLLIFFTLYLWLKISYKNGNIFFIQKRIGKKGKIFNCFKFRTMQQNSSNILKNYLLENPEEVEYYEKYKKYKNDPRVTKVGKFLRKTSLDELPQIINVLKNEMNLVGPRPYMCKERVFLEEDLDIILAVNPGITGLWQVSGRNNTTFEQRLEIDRYYIRNWSIWMDFVIFVKTIKTVLLRDGAR